MKTHIHINDRADELCRIEIEGTIGVPEAWQFDDPAERVATYERFRETVARIAAIEAPEVIVTIRSTGGDVNDALLIHDTLRQLGGRITTRCYGYTASAATIIAQAASEGCRELSANALYLIHRASCATEGNADDLGAQLELLQATDGRLAALYAARSGRTPEEFGALMAENGGNGRWLSPEEAIAAGLADRLIDPAGAAEQPRAVRNLASGWRRLLAAVGLEKPLPLPADRNVLHFDREMAGREPADRETARRTPDAPEHAARREAAASAALQRIEPTRTLPTEDPSFGEPCRSPNERAYAEDAAAFNRG